MEIDESYLALLKTHNKFIKQGVRTFAMCKKILSNKYY